MPFVLSYKQGIAMFISILALMSAGASVQCAQNGDPVASNTPEAATVLLLPVLNDIGKNGKEEKWALGRLHDELSKWFRDQGMEVIEIKPETDKPTDGSIDPSSPLSREQCGMLDLGKKNGADYVASCRLLYYQIIEKAGWGATYHKVGMATVQAKLFDVSRNSFDLTRTFCSEEDRTRFLFKVDGNRLRQNALRRTVSDLTDALGETWKTPSPAGVLSNACGGEKQAKASADADEQPELLNPPTTRVLVLPMANCSLKHGPEETAACEMATDLIKKAFTELGFGIVSPEESAQKDNNGSDLQLESSREQDALTEIAKAYKCRIIASCVLNTYTSHREDAFLGYRKTGDIKIEMKVLDAERSHYLALGLFGGDTHGPGGPLFPSILLGTMISQSAKSKDLRTRSLANAIASSLNDLAQHYTRTAETEQVK